MTAAASPWSFNLHLASLAIVAAVAVGYGIAVSRPGWEVTRRQIVSFAGGLLLLVVATAWPVADLAAHWSLTALVTQRLLLLLAVPPLLVLGSPDALLEALARPAPVDAVVRTVCRPVPAIGCVTVIAAATLTTGAVDLQAANWWARAILDVVLLAAGFVLWAPVLHRLPGVPRPGSYGRAGYLIVQSIVPSFLAVVWIFARHPLYSAFAHHTSVAGLTPIVDQQVAGFVAKLTTIAVLWTVAFVVLGRAQRTVIAGGDPDPLTWADVSRELSRAERHRTGLRALLPPPGGTPVGRFPDARGPGATKPEPPPPNEGPVPGTPGGQQEPPP